MVGPLLVGHEGPVAEAAAVALVTAVSPLVLENTKSCSLVRIIPICKCLHALFVFDLTPSVASK